MTTTQNKNKELDETIMKDNKTKALKEMEANNPTEKLLNEMEVVEVVRIVEVEKKKQKVSISYLMKSWGENLAKLKELELITDNEYSEMIKIRISAIQKWIS